MFYDVYSELCAARGMSLSRVASEIGLSNSTVTKWKKTGATPSGETLSKIANYFNVSIGRLLSNEPKENDLAQMSEAEMSTKLKHALFDGAATDAQFEEVKRFARFIKERDADGGNT